MTADQYDCTAAVLKETPDAIVVSNLGVASYVLSGVEDRPRNFYLWGSMGSTVATAVGVALGTDEQVTVLTGDGSLTMSLGVLSTVRTADPSNLTIVCFDNGVYGTTGGQSTPEIDFAACAEACGVTATSVEDEAAFESAYSDAVDTDAPSLIDCAVSPIDPTERPPYDFAHVTRRVRDSVTGNE